MSNDSVYHKFYTSSAWKKLRLRKLQDSPLCEHCLLNGITTVGKHIDHIIPIVKAEHLALDYNNLQTLCISCHSIKTTAENKPATELDKLADNLKDLLK